jgi:hypothetical protein
MGHEHLALAGPGMTDRSLDVRLSEDGGLLAFKITDDPHTPWVIVTVDEDGMYTTYTRVTPPSGTRPVRLLGDGSVLADGKTVLERLGYVDLGRPHITTAEGTRVTRLDAEGKPTGEAWTP